MGGTDPSAAIPLGRGTETSGLTVAALYVEKDGAYFGLPNVDPWDEARNAMLYDGPYPVVAHPPCNVWSIMANCRPEIVKDQDGGKFEHALNAVRQHGGVLEHPAHTRAWKRFGLTKPISGAWSWPDEYGGRVTEVDQRHYGHRCRKATWLYYVGPEPDPLRAGDGERGEPTFSEASKRGKHANTHNNHSQRSATPAEFRDLLIRLAQSTYRFEELVDDPEPYCHFVWIHTDDGSAMLARGSRSRCGMSEEGLIRVSQTDSVDRLGTYASRRKPKRAKQLGVSDEEYAVMLESQGGRCAIPGCIRTPKTRRFHVDHDHRTGAVRGLLCHLHNRYLPKDSTEALRMYDYLKAHE